MDKNTQAIDRLSGQVVVLFAKIDTLATKEELNEKFNTVITGQDRILKILETMQQEKVATDASIERIQQTQEKEKIGDDKQDAKLQDHEKRIKWLELTVG